MRSRIIIAVAGLISMLLVAQVMISAQTDDPPAPPSGMNAEPTLDPFPRPTDWEIIVAEQVFENGRMFYLAPNQRIWVMIESEDDDTVGDWLVFADDWQEGEPEFDSAMVPPDGMHQPIRGFGKLWRNNDDLRDALGWGLDPEIGHLSRYQFFAGETMDTDQGMMQLPGYHVLRSFYGRTFAFNEAEMTWEVLNPPQPAAEGMDEEMEDTADMSADAEATAEAESADE